MENLLSLAQTMPLSVGVLLGLAALYVAIGPGPAGADQASAIQLSAQHQEAVSRRRRIVLQYDVLGILGSDWAQWSAHVMEYTNEPGNQ